MSPAEKQQQLVLKFSLIEDPQERMASIVEHARRLPVLPEEHRSDANRVHGCVSRVWLTARTDEGMLRLQLDADSTLVKGLAWLMCETCDGTPAADVAAFYPSILDQLQLTAHLSPTRRAGLEQVQQRIRELARRLSG